MATAADEVLNGVGKLDDALKLALAENDGISTEDTSLKKALSEIRAVLLKARKDLAVARIDLQYYGEIPF